MTTRYQQAMARVKRILSEVEREEADIEATKIKYFFLGIFAGAVIAFDVLRAIAIVTKVHP